MVTGSYVSDNGSDENPIDRNVFLLLIVAALIVLIRRDINWRLLIGRNRWLFLFYLFFGFSIAWSDYSVVAFKQWLKDIGSVLVVLVILTEKHPMEAARIVFARCAYALIPLSVLYIKYFPELGKTFSRFTGTTQYHGVAMGKNLLGASVLVVTLFLVWDLVSIVRKQSKTTQKVEILNLTILLVMAGWLLRIADSATSVACAICGSLALVALSTEFVRHRLRHFVAWSAGAAVVLVLVSSVVDLKGNMATMLGRDPTLHGRSEIWELVLAEGTNPVIGTGFSSFWLGTRPQQLQGKTGQFYLLNQAHNGYLEIYLNGGVIALGLLLAFLLVASKNIRQQLLVDPNWAGFRLVVWLVVIIHNWSEATFCKLSPLWVALLVVSIEYSRNGRRDAIGENVRVRESSSVSLGSRDCAESAVCNGVVSRATQL